jgi:endogenous inhibitor of DNA gyrase (YacG/DUF329 family)
MTRLMYSEPCPACRKPVEFDPYDKLPAGFGVPFPCPHCGEQIMLEGEDMPDENGSYEYEYWFERAACGGEKP